MTHADNTRVNAFSFPLAHVICLSQFKLIKVADFLYNLGEYKKNVFPKLNIVDISLILNGTMAIYS